METLNRKIMSENIAKNSVIKILKNCKMNTSDIIKIRQDYVRYSVVYDDYCGQSFEKRQF